MAWSIRAVFDGEVLRPERPIELRRDATYLITIEGEAPIREVRAAEHTYPLTAMGRLAADMGVTDLSTRHDRSATMVNDGTQEVPTR
jgi:hypothetical protein